MTKCGAQNAELSPKSLRDPRSLGLRFNLAEHGRGADAVPAIVEPAVVRLPATLAPVPEPDAQVVARRVAEDDGEGEDEAGLAVFIHFPAFRHQAMFDGGVDDVRMNRRHLSEGGAQLVALQHLAVLLAFVEVQVDLHVVDIEIVAALLDRDPAVARVGIDHGSVERELGIGTAVDLDGRLIDDFHAIAAGKLRRFGRLSDGDTAFDRELGTVGGEVGQQVFALALDADGRLQLVDSGAARSEQAHQPDAGAENTGSLVESVDVGHRRSP